MIPDGIWCSTNSPAPVSTVWPALAPPWYRTTRSARSASTSTILPLPSSPHWAPTTTTQCVFGPNMALPALQQKRPGGRGAAVSSGRSILWGKLDRAPGHVNATLKRSGDRLSDRCDALKRQSLCRIPRRVHHPRRPPTPSHDGHALAHAARQHQPVLEHRQQAGAPRRERVHDCVHQRPAAMHEGEGAPEVVDAVEV